VGELIFTKCGFTCGMSERMEGAFLLLEVEGWLCGFACANDGEAGEKAELLFVGVVVWPFAKNICP
jgi:hypothetical protein